MNRRANLSDLDTTPRATSAPPRIGVVSQWLKNTTYLKLPLAYVSAIDAAGGTPVLLSTFDAAPGDEPKTAIDILCGFDPLDSSGLDGVAGLLIPGGGDVDPEWYGCERHPKTTAVNHRRDRFEQTLLSEALRRDMPVLAICHGMQLLNVCRGGTLDQHLADKMHLLDHAPDKPRPDPVHRLRIKERTVLAEIFGAEAAEVNSNHHQGLADLGDALAEIAWADDGVVEAVVSTEHTWVVGVQWHPEVMAPVDARQRALFQAFVRTADAYTRSKLVADGVTAARSA